MVKPTLGNLVLWRVLTVEDGVAQVDAVRVGRTTRVYPGERAELLHPTDWQHLPENSRLRRDLERMYRYSDRLLTMHPEGPTGAEAPIMIGDVRFAMLPTSAAPLWGIVVSFDQPEGETRWENRRTLTPQMRAQFLAMVLNRDITL